MNRVVEPEILDELMPDDPRAIRARRDLRRINYWMGNARLIARTLKDLFPNPPQRIVELGAGDGSLMLEVARRLPWNGAPVEFLWVDRRPPVTPATVIEYDQLNWRVKVVMADVFDWITDCKQSDVIITNLFLHHFQPDQLRQLFRHAAEKTDCFIACEPPRSRQALLSCRLMPLIGIGEVALNDAYISIRAGFRDNELSQLWPDTGNWTIREGKAGLFNHLFTCVRKEAARADE